MFFSKKIAIPMVIIMVLTVALMGYALFFQKSEPRGDFDRQQAFQNGERPEFHDHHEGGGVKGTMKDLGTYSIIAGAVAFSWFMMKKTIKSKFPPLKKLSKYTFKAHYWVGWLAVVTTAVHGTYFLWTDFNKRGTWDGLAATLPLFALAIYGWLMRKSRNKPIMRKIHVSLAILWVIALLVHAGGQVIQVTVLTLLAWGIIYWINKEKNVRTTLH